MNMAGLQNRILSIDVLRGMMASAVMVYHFCSWSMGGLGADSVLGRFGLFGVSIFYLVSGFSLAAVYWDRGINSLVELKIFCIKRFFRVAPLFYAASTVFLVFGLLNGQSSLEKFILNYTFLFSVIDPTAYYATGGWSIGNEIVFYLLFSIILMTRHRSWLLVVFLFFFGIVQVYYRFFLFSQSDSLSSQWGIYVNPLNHAVYFFSGVASYIFYRALHGKSQMVLFVCLSLIIFIAPFNGDRVNLVFGWPGVVLSLSSIGLFVLFLVFKESSVFRFRPLVLLGDWSYSIYLLHPICWFVFDFFWSHLSLGFSLFVVLAASFFTFFVAALSFNFFEKPFSRFGRALARNYE